MQIIFINFIFYCIEISINNNNFTKSLTSKIKKYFVHLIVTTM